MRFTLLLVVFLMLTGCAGGPKVYKTSYEKGSILVLPARDVVQNGKPHDIGAGSGKLLTEEAAKELRSKGFETTICTSDSLSHLTEVTPQQALEEGKSANCRYCLTMMLGEFRNAAPMTFRTDFVVLDKATLFDTQTGQKVWELEQPILLEKSNIGNHLGLIEDMAKTVAKSIAG